MRAYCRPIYTAPKSLSGTHSDAVHSAWLRISFEALLLVERRADNMRLHERGLLNYASGILELAQARRLASDARDLLAAFGVRHDGKRKKPFRHQFPRKVVRS